MEEKANEEGKTLFSLGGSKMTSSARKKGKTGGVSGGRKERAHYVMGKRRLGLGGGNTASTEVCAQAWLCELGVDW